MSRRSKQSAPLLTPPQGFSILESNLYRALEPIYPEHLPFLKRLKIGSCFIVSLLTLCSVLIAVTTSPLNETILSFVDENDGVTLVLIPTFFSHEFP
jgi:hypothetical protein